MNDNGEFLPPINHYLSGVGLDVWNWPYGLYADGYVPSIDLYRCPSLKPAQAGIYDLWELKLHPSEPERYLYIAYGYNMYYLGSSCNPTTGWSWALPQARLPQIKKPSETIMLGDAWHEDSRVGFYGLISPESVTVWGVIHCLHGRGANIGWVDGHVTGELNACQRFQKNGGNAEYFDRN